MNNGVEVRNKLLAIIKEILLSNPDVEVPAAVENCILENYGWTIDEKSSSEKELNDFAQIIEKWIECVRSSRNYKKPNKEDRVELDLSGVFEKYLDAELEYVNITSKLVEALEKAVKFKEKYSEEFNSKCKFQKNSMEVLIRKLQLLKIQFFLKLYGESNALNAHVKLQEKLMDELQSLTKCYNEALLLSNQFDEIKTDKKFMDLCKIYKELKRIEKRSVIIGNM